VVAALLKDEAIGNGELMNLVARSGPSCALPLAAAAV
jgi:hypothetical protein